MTDAQRVMRDLLKEVVECVNRQGARIDKLTDVTTGVARLEIRAFRMASKRLRYDPSSGCCHGRKR